jgi:very-long-chain (3R)-3-hydroxyacyl-CoA dehydratase
MFYALYPIGIGAEWWLLYRAIAPAREISGVIAVVFYGCLAAYVPGKSQWGIVGMRIC